MESKVVVLGDADFCIPFSALGLDTFAIDNDPADIAEKAEAVLASQYALIVVAENIASAVEKVFAAEQGKAIPCVVIVPFTATMPGLATKTLSNVMKMATGINILEDT